MSDDELRKLIASNAKSIEALTNALASDGEERRKEQNQLYQYLGRLASAQSSFYEVQADYYHQLAALSERQTRTDEQIVKILRHLSIPENEES